jgi:hypothetical protein
VRPTLDFRGQTHKIADFRGQTHKIGRCITAFELAGLNRHALFLGTTGSGKTDSTLSDPVQEHQLEGDAPAVVGRGPRPDRRHRAVLRRPAGVRRSAAQDGWGTMAA